MIEFLLAVALHVAPAFTASDRSGVLVTVDVQKEPYAGKPVVLYFWHTACGPCLKHIPELVALARKHPDVSVVTVIGTIGDDDSAYLPRALADVGVDVADLPFAVLFDEPEFKRTEHSAWKRYGVRSFGTMVLVNAEGLVLPFTYLDGQRRCSFVGIDWGRYGERVIEKVKEGEPIQIRNDTPGEYDAPCPP